jgi:hypothetical protein
MRLRSTEKKEYIARYLTLTPNGYNIQTGGDDRPPMSDEQKEALRKKMTGNTFRLGILTTEEVKQKLRKANVGKTLSVEHRNKIAVSHIGKQHTKESKEKMALAKLGTKMSPESTQKKRVATLGKPRSEEIKKNMMAAQRARRAKEKNVRQFGSEGCRPI